MDLLPGQKCDIGVHPRYNVVVCVKINKETAPELPGLTQSFLSALEL